jgi:O-acetyl-ADP-ribose deacetylase (regulator of RNase III)
MKIQEIKTNLMYATQPIIAHGVNCKGVMGAGVAKLIKAKYPLSCSAYVDYCKANKPEDLLGKILVTQDTGKTIIHCFTQLAFGTSRQQVDYTALRSCIKLLNEAAKKAGWTEIVMPKIGSGLGGGDWNEIVKIIEEESTNFQPLVSIISK